MKRLYVTDSCGDVWRACSFSVVPLLFLVLISVSHSRLFAEGDERIGRRPELTSFLSIMGGYDDNTNLSEQDGDGAFVGGLDAGVDLEGDVSEKLDLNLKYKFNYVMNSSQTALEEAWNKESQRVLTHTVEGALNHWITDTFSWAAIGEFRYNDTESVYTTYMKYFGGASFQYAPHTKLLVGAEAVYGLKNYFQYPSERIDGFFQIDVNMLKILDRNTFLQCGYQSINYVSGYSDHDYTGHRPYVLISTESLITDTIGGFAMCQYQVKNYATGDQVNTFFFGAGPLAEFDPNTTISVEYQLIMNRDHETSGNFNVNRYIIRLKKEF